MGFLIAFLTFLVYSSTEKYEPKESIKEGSYVGAQVPSTASDAAAIV